MRKIAYAVAFLAGLLVNTVDGQQAQPAQLPEGAIAVEIVIDTTLPRGVLAATTCNGNHPVILAPYQPSVSTLLHEGVHVRQIMDNGGCPGGYDSLTKSPAVLLAYEAEAHCIVAMYNYYKHNIPMAPVLAQNMRWLHQASVERAKRRGKPEWELSIGQVSAAFTKEPACRQPPEPVNRSNYNGRLSSSGKIYSTVPGDTTVHWHGGPRHDLAED